MSSRPAPSPPADEMPPDPDGIEGANERQLVADTGKVTLATSASYFINLIGSLVLARILGASMVSYWKDVQLAATYTVMANFGTQMGLTRTAPGLIERGKPERYRAFMRASITFSALMGLGLGAVFLVWAWLEPPGPRRIALLFIALVAMVQQFYSLGETALSVEKKFGKHSLMVFFTTLLRVILAAVGAYFYGLPGALAAYWLTVVLGAAYSWSRSIASPMPTRPVPARAPKGIMRVGLPIMVLMFAELFLMTVDRIFVTTFFPDDISGLYYYAFFAEPILLLVPRAVRATTSIDIYGRFSRVEGPKSCREVYERSVMAIALGSPVIIGAVYLGVPWVMEWVLPDFSAALPVLKAYAIAVFPLMIVQTAFAVCVVSGREFHLVGGMIGFGLLAVGASWTGFQLLPEMGTFHVILIHAAAWLAWGLVLTWATLRLVGAGGFEAARRTARWFLPMVFVAVWLPALEWGLSQLGLRPHTLVFGLVGGALHMVACAPLLWGLERRTGGLTFLARRFGLRR